MRHVYDHIISMGCVRRCSTEEKAHAHKQFKKLYTNYNKHVAPLAPLILASWVDHTSIVETHSDDGSDTDLASISQEITDDNTLIWASFYAQHKQIGYRVSAAVSGHLELSDKFWASQQIP